MLAPRRRSSPNELRERLLSERADAPIHAIGGGIWMRISAHAYNEIDDYERLAGIVRGACYG